MPLKDNKYYIWVTKLKNQFGYPKKMNTKIYFIIGVSGVGKSTIGKHLSKKLKLPFFDGDDFHSKKNIQKMSDGLPLNDEDRLEWLQSLNELAKKNSKEESCIIVCSALKNKYRQMLSKNIENQVKWIFLKGNYKQIKERMDQRENHFMDSQLLKSQFDILEIPKNAIHIDVHLTPAEIVNTLEKELLLKSEFGVFGLGVMGKSLSRNLASNGIKLSLYNRHIENEEENIASTFKNLHEELSSAMAFDDVSLFVNSLQKPKAIMLMVNAGKTIDAVIESLLPFLSKGDVLIDGGNSNYKKTNARMQYLNQKGIAFIGAGISGGEEGALKGPAIMPGGNREAYEMVLPFLETIAAKDKNKLPCCTYMGKDGSGHFVKMIHNGIEYVEMQLLAEIYVLFKSLGKNPDEIAEIFESWKETTNSYLLEITIDILRKKEGEDWLLDKIMDKAGNKGTGNWATITTAELGVPSTMIASALFARYTSFYKEERCLASKNIRSNINESIALTVDDLLRAYQFGRIINHYQGFKLIQEASTHYDWNLNLSELARIWTNGCIIKSDLMNELVTIFKSTNHLLSTEHITNTLKELKPAIKKVVSVGIIHELSLPCLTESISFSNSFSTENSSANLIQAQRDYFGAHTYQRTDDKSNTSHHTDWSSKK